jgi:hypothetical protein
VCWVRGFISRVSSISDETFCNLPNCYIATERRAKQKEEKGDHTPKGCIHSVGLKGRKEGRKDCVMGASACDERWICSHLPHPSLSLPPPLLYMYLTQHTIQSFSLSVSELSIRVWEGRLFQPLSYRNPPRC